MANASFYRLKFGTIDCWLIDEWVATSWLDDNSYLLSAKKIIDNVIIWTDLNHESSRNCLSFPGKKRWNHLDF
jgi:hypothetical protein